MRKLFTVVVVFAALAGMASAQAPDLSKMDIVMKSVPDGPVARIGDYVIERAEFLRFYENELRGIMMTKKTNDIPDGARAELALRCIGLIIERELLYSEAVKRNVTVPADTVEKAWQAQLAQTQKLIESKEGKTLSEAEVLARVGYGKREEVLVDLEHMLITEKMRGIVLRESNITVSDEEVAKEFEQTKSEFDVPARLHLQHIYVDPKKIPGGVTDKDARAHQKAQQALDRLAAGQSFEGVSRAVSDAPNAKDGGDFGMMPISKLPPFMVEAAAEMKAGEISGVIKSEHGYHIVKLISIEGARAASQTDASPEVRQRLLAKRGAEAVHAFCEKLIQDGSEVHVFLELEKNLALNGALPNAGQ
jgi:parvulin-like peptidyl-prolyl isomerase